MKQKLSIALCVLLLIGLHAPPTYAQNQASKALEGVSGAKGAKVKGDILVMETNMGTIEFKLFRSLAPKTVENFVQLGKKGFYNNVLFHRVIDGFMIQGGDPTTKDKSKRDYWGTGGESIYGRTFVDEFSPKLTFDKAGLLAMANSGPNTNGSQFFITLVPTPHLNNRHTIYGEVVKGMDVVKAIGKVKTGERDIPVEDVFIKKISMK